MFDSDWKDQVGTGSKWAQSEMAKEGMGEGIGASEPADKCCDMLPFQDTCCALDCSATYSDFCVQSIYMPMHQTGVYEISSTD